MVEILDHNLTFYHQYNEALSFKKANFQTLGHSVANTYGSLSFFRPKVSYISSFSSTALEKLLKQNETVNRQINPQCKSTIVVKKVSEDLG